MPEETPLPTLLSWVWISYVIEADNLFESISRERVGRRFRISMAMWANGLRLIDEGGVSVADLQSRAGAACNLAGLERWRWIDVGDTSSGRRDGYGTQRGRKPDSDLRPTRGGSYARKLWPQVVAEVEERWRARFGGEAIDALAAALRIDPPMPWAVPEVHPADGFRTHVVDGGGGGDAPFIALASQRLVALTLDLEEGAAASLPLAANLLRVVGSGVARIRDLPVLTGVSKEAVAMATGFAARRSLARLGPGRTIQLTEGGLQAVEEYRRRAREVKDDRLRHALDAVLEQGEALSACFVPPEGCWRGEHPYLAQTQRLVARPTAAMPWHPMVLHRGGWPDGS